MSVIRALLKSRKFVSALTALAGSVAVVLGFEEAVAAKLTTAPMIMMAIRKNR